MALRRRPAGGGVKPPHGALAEDFVNMNAGTEAGKDDGLGDRGAAREMEVVWPSRVVLRRKALNRRKGRRLNAVVLSVVEKARRDRVRCGPGR